MKLLRNVSVKISFKSLQIALVSPSGSTVLFHHIFCGGLCRNVEIKKIHMLSFQEHFRNDLI
jgi:hypothetical protein